MGQIFRPAVVLEEHNTIFIVENAEVLAVRVMVGDRPGVTITTMKAIVREKLKVLHDVPDMPYQSETQCIHWMKLVNPDLSCFIGPLEAVGNALQSILDKGIWFTHTVALRTL